MLFDSIKGYIIGRKLKNLRKNLRSAKFTDIKKRINNIDWKIIDLIVKYKLRKTLDFSAKNTPMYKHELPGIISDTSLDKIYSIINKIPFTNPEEVSRNPEMFLSIPYSDVVGFHFTAGTTGKKKKLFLAKSDIEMIVYNYYLGLLMQNLSREDVIQIMYSFGIWQLGNIYQQALSEMGVKFLPTGNGIGFNEQANLIKEFNVSVLTGTPSYIYQLARSIDLPKSSRDNIKSIIMGGEHLTSKKKSFIEDKLGGETFLAYGLMEFGGGVGSECKNHNGYHILTTVYPEIVDIKTSEPVKKEEYGELVLTSLDREAMPLLRYRTGDITRFIEGECECGLKLPKIDFVKSRTDDRVTIGTAEKYYPIVFEELFDDIVNVSDFQIKLVKDDDRDCLKVYVVTDDPSEELRLKIIRKFYEIDSLKRDIEKTKTINAPEIIFTDQINQEIKKRSIIDNRIMV
jgi:phenylacetate-CoA ligase